MGTTHSENAISGSRDTVDPKFLEAMERLLEYKLPGPPEGSFTVEEAADQWEVEPNTAYKKLSKMYKDGLLERVSLVNNKMYYWFKE